MPVMLFAAADIEGGPERSGTPATARVKAHVLGGGHEADACLFQRAEAMSGVLAIFDVIEGATRNMSNSLPVGRMIAADEEGLASALGRMAATVGRFREGETPFEYVARGPQIIRDHVTWIANALADADAFDVVELLRMREMPMALDGYRESVADHFPAAIDLVSLILLARGHRARLGADTARARPAAVIAEIHDRASELLTVGTFTLLASGQKNEFGPLTMLAASYVSHDLTVQFKQYLHIHDEINSALFSSIHLGDLLVESIGFSYEDFVAVREAIGEVLSDKFFAVRDELGDVAREWAESGRNGQDPARVAEGQRAFRDMMELPAGRAAFTAVEIAKASGVEIERVQRVLERFSLPFGDPFDPVAAVEAFLRGDNPFRTVTLLRDAEDRYITLGEPIGTDCFRQVIEAALKDDQAKFRRYERRRAAVSEQLSMKHLTKLLGESPAHVNLKYFRAKPGIDVASLGPHAEDVTTLADQTEADGLFLIEDVAVCVEVKGKSLSRQTRQGNVQRLTTDLRTTVGEATSQALRLEEHIRTNGGLWLEDRSWLDLSSIREIRSVAVALDDLGPLATALDELVRANVIKSDRFPWIVTLHDLAVVAEVVDRPAEFLLYLRRRTESEVSLKYWAIDELDLFMLFFDGGLYVEPDPDRVGEEFLGMPRPNGADRRRYRESSVPTRVMTHTDPLDAWVYYREGSSAEAAQKPSFVSHPGVLDLVDFLQDGKKPGWFRFSADLLNLSEESQGSVAAAIEQTISMTLEDGQTHHSFMAFAGSWGYPTLFIGSRPASMPPQEASKRLAMYGIAKKHQIKSDRALMVLFDQHGTIRSIRYDNAPPRDDARLDEAAALMGLIPPETMARPIPPSARRETKRLNPRKKHKKRR